MRDSCTKPLETIDSEGTRVKDLAAVETVSYVRIQNPEDNLGFHHARLLSPEICRGTSYVKLHKLETKKVPKMETPEPDRHQQESRDDVALPRRKRENDQDQEEKRRKKKKSGLRESSPVETKNRPASKTIVKTVSIRLRDIRHTDSVDYSIDPGSPNKAYTVSTTTTKPNGWLRKAHSTQANGSLPSSRSSGNHLKNWGKFRIPKRSERPLGVPKEEETLESAPQQGKPLLRPLTNTPEPSYPRTRLRTGTENAAYTPDAKSSDGGSEPCMKRCHSHQLRGDSTLSRRYGSDIIRRGVLAS